jgi:hypothetical protein
MSRLSRSTIKTRCLNATMKPFFDVEPYNINIVPQDIKEDFEFDY